jgi:hypothetical protein
MLSASFLIVFAVACGFAEQFTTDQMTVVADVKSNVFSYEVTNRAEKALVGIRIPQHATYDFIVPDGWETQIEGEILHIWTAEPLRFIRHGDSIRFSMRVSSHGAVLGKRDMTLGLEGEQTLNVAGVWVPVPEPSEQLWLVAGCLMVILSVHAAGSWLFTRPSHIGNASP